MRVLFAIAELFVHPFDMYDDPGIAELRQAVSKGIFDEESLLAFRRLNDRGEVFRLSWGRTSLDPLDRYAVGTAMKSASFASQIVYTYIEPVLSY